MTDLLLSVNMTLSIFVDQLLTMGLPVIDKSLAELMNVMKTQWFGNLLCPLCWFIRMLDDDTWSSWYRCYENP